MGKKKLAMALGIRRKPWIFSMAFLYELIRPYRGECYAIRTYLKNEVRVQDKARNGPPSPRLWRDK